MILLKVCLLLPGIKIMNVQEDNISIIYFRHCPLNCSVFLQVTDAMICSGDGGETTSGCHGDSGGPFVCHINGRSELYGAVSHGSSRCDSSTSYSVYARVVHFRKWIDEAMRQ